MVLPTAPPASMSISQIKNEMQPTVPSPSIIPNSANTLYGNYGQNSVESTYFSKFSGKSFTYGDYSPNLEYTFLNVSVYNNNICSGDGIATDSQGNVYVVGKYPYGPTAYTIGFPPVSTGYTFSGGGGAQSTMYLMKYSQAGVLLGYTILFLVNTTSSGRSVEIDSGDNVYITGTYTSPTTFPIKTIGLPPTDSGYSLPISTGSDVFVFKYNSSGSLLGYTYLSGTGGDTPLGLAVDPVDNSVYISGSYTSTTTVPINTLGLPPTASGYSLPISTTSDMFVLRYSSDGGLIGYTYFQGSGADNARGLAIDSGRNVYITGTYISTTTVTINSLTLTPTASGYSLPILTGSVLYILKYNSSGVLLGYSYTRIADTGFASSVAVDPVDNSVYITGQTAGGGAGINTIGLPPTASGSNMPVTTGIDMFAIKWSSSGALLGYTTLAGVGTDVGNSIKVDAGSNVYITGAYVAYNAVAPIKTFQVPPVASGYNLPITTPASSITTSDTFVLKYNSSGTLLAFTYIPTSVPTSGTIESGNAIAFDSNSNVYITGTYTANVTTAQLYTLSLTPYAIPNALLPQTIPGTATGYMFLLKYSFPNKIWTPLSSDTQTVLPPGPVDPTASIFTSPGTYIWRPGEPGKTMYANVFVMGGGGGGGTFGGGGGGGGYVYRIGLDVNSDTAYPITVGAGGASDTNGQPSSFSTLVTAEGGGAGGGVISTIIGSREGRSGSGSGGGGGYGYKGGTAPPQGRNGGSGGKSLVTGGGGGASSVGLAGSVKIFAGNGQSGQTVQVGGVGGPGIFFPITGLTYGGGGSGGGNTLVSDYTPTPAPGGGGTGDGANYNATPGTNGRGGGGGGTGVGTNKNPTTGGSGVVIVQLPTLIYQFTTPNPATPYTTSWTSTVTGNVQVLVVGGGGSGGYYNPNGKGGGGGGGGVIFQSFPVISGNPYTIVVGGGGQATSIVVNGGNPGGNSSISSPGLNVIAYGGGTAGQPGGSGGGGYSPRALASNLVSFPNIGGSGVAGQGFAGGSLLVNPGIGRAASGGGAGAAAANVPGPALVAVPGGAGKLWPVNGVTYGGGGGGGTIVTSGGVSLGGPGGGGNGCGRTAAPAIVPSTAGTNGLGGGGGGGNQGPFPSGTISQAASPGGSGIVAIAIVPSTL